MDVQNALADMLQMETQRLKAKEEILTDLEERKEGLRKIGDEMIEQLDKERELDQMRMDLASNSALADALAQFSEVEEQVQRVRNQLQADKADLAAWEQKTAAERNEGLFFKSLYKPDKSKDDEPAGTAEAYRRLTTNIKAPADQELRSPLRLYLFTYLAAVLAIVVVADLFSPSPSLATDGALALVGVLLGFNAWSERTEFVKSAGDGVQQDKEKEL